MAHGTLKHDTKDSYNIKYIRKMVLFEIMAGISATKGLQEKINFR